jgi:uncharacterized protein YdaL
MRNFDVIMIELPNGELLPLEQAKEYCNKAIEILTISMELDKALNEYNSLSFERSKYQERRNQYEVTLKSFQSTMKVIETIENVQRGE